MNILLLLIIVILLILNYRQSQINNKENFYQINGSYIPDLYYPRVYDLKKYYWDYVPTFNFDKITNITYHPNENIKYNYNSKWDWGKLSNKDKNKYIPATAQTIKPVDVSYCKNFEEMPNTQKIQTIKEVHVAKPLTTDPKNIGTPLKPLSK